MIHFDVDCPEIKANKILADNGIKLSPLSTCVKDKSRAAFSGNTYIVGYGEMTISKIRDGIALWSDLWKEYL